MVKGAAMRLDRSRLQLLERLDPVRKFWCGACHKSCVGFFRYGTEVNWGCPHCGASPRERFVSYAIDQGLLQIGGGACVLQIAPNESGLVRRFRAAGNLVTGDLQPERYPGTGAIKVDLMNFASLGRFDLIYASHVLEHVPSDFVVLRNLFSALNNGGQVWLIVPLAEGPTREGHDQMSPGDREREFGQWDHVRQYGDDFGERLLAAGFAVQVLGVDSLPQDQQVRLGLSATDRIFVGKKNVE